MKTFELFIMCISAIIIMIGIVFFQAEASYDCNCNCLNNITIQDNNTISDLEFTQELITRFSENNKFNIGPNGTIYACEESSQELKDIAKKLGIIINTKSGFIHEENGGHIWNTISFDYDIKRNKLVAFKKY